MRKHHGFNASQQAIRQTAIHAESGESLHSNQTRPGAPPRGRPPAGRKRYRRAGPQGGRRSRSPRLVVPLAGSRQPRTRGGRCGMGLSFAVAHHADSASDQKRDQHEQDGRTEDEQAAGLRNRYDAGAVAEGAGAAPYAALAHRWPVGPDDGGGSCERAGRDAHIFPSVRSMLARRWPCMRITSMRRPMCMAPSAKQARMPRVSMRHLSWEPLPGTADHSAASLRSKLCLAPSASSTNSLIVSGGSRVPPAARMAG